MATPAHHNVFSDEPLVSGPSLTTINSNLVVHFSSLDEDGATHIPQKLDNSAYPEKSPHLIDGHDDDDVYDEHGDGSNEWGGGDVTAEYDGSEEDHHGLVRCSSAASITSNYIHSMGESSGFALGQNMDHMGVEEVWNNEKHNEYLDLMEENFVRDMYAHDYCSLELCANQPQYSQSESETESESEASVVYTGTSSDIMDEVESESESESSVVYSCTIIDDKMMSSEDAPQCMETTISSSSSSSPSSCFSIRRKGDINYINNAKKEKGSVHSHATSTTTDRSTSTTASRNKKRKSTTFPSFANSAGIRLDNLLDETLEHPRLIMIIWAAYSRRRVVPNPCTNSTGSHQEMQGLAKISRAKANDLGSTTKPSQLNSRIDRT